jgi:LPS-assembly lipoprotein
MSSSERIFPRYRRTMVAMALIAAAGLQACTVRPLYMNAPQSPSGQSYTAELASIAVKPVSTRHALEVRNHLIFLFGGGQGEPADPRYTLDLRVSPLAEASTLIQVGTENEPTSAMLTMKASYRLFNAAGDIVATGNRQITSSYDVPRQEFAALRARRDAENRAARELAELLRLAVAQNIANPPAQPAVAPAQPAAEILPPE